MSLLVIGEALIDVIEAGGEVTERPGGSPANVAIGVSRLGIPARLLTSFGDDARGEALIDWLGADHVFVERAPAERTASATALIGADGSARYTFDIAWDLAGAAVDVSRVSHVHTGSIGALLEPGATSVLELVRRARGVGAGTEPDAGADVSPESAGVAGATVSYDPNIRPALIEDMVAVRGRVRELIALADVVKCSDEDLAYLFDTDVPDETAVIAYAHEFAATGPALVAVTRGSQGVIAVNRAGDIVRVPAPDVDVVDTVGAGDSFMAALIYQLDRRGLTGAKNRAALNTLGAAELAEICEFAARAAAITCSREGANPPSIDEL
ncbi:fructokinase [Arcanobacterium wilhelmae]|uniref:Fructokinase n=1 Tax=Arcanobacterium wilhelmae TaxID=1803177 RepID=A0ABT9N9R2_9ACTO|nr:carbohydrate kinase [Arcanobacterium wilhelmae]MDP9800450.1 fructokinase [Arcanobacterium wilhelmae]WFN89870.1 carbohydrate kinase [Arcanobacterium wilhelmae]